MDCTATPSTSMLVLTTAKAGGAERALAYLVGRLPSLGFEPTVQLLESGPLEEWLAAGCCERVVVPPSRTDPSCLARELIEQVDARIVLSSKWDAHLFGGPAARDAGIPAVWWQHDIARDTPAQIEASSYPAAAIVCSSRLAIEAQQQLTPSGNVVQIQPGVPVGELASRATRSPRDRSAREWSRPPLIGIVGRLQSFKAQHVFLEAAALVAQRRRDARFVVVGGAVLGTEGDYPRMLERLALQLGLGDQLRFVGHQTDVAPWLDAIDVLVHATDGEPFGLVLVEAMAMGTPVVATNAGGPPEIIVDRESGWLAAWPARGYRRRSSRDPPGRQPPSPVVGGRPSPRAEVHSRADDGALRLAVRIDR